MRLVILCVLAFLPATLNAQWRLIWSDEFNGVSGAKPDPVKWTYDLGGGGWGNQELETYTNATENAHLDGQGNLAIQASKTATGYTSARIKTKGLFTTKYGRIEARIKIPFGQGIWPAFWMLGANIDSVNWPQCGEIDIMENIGKEPAMIHGTLHGPGYSGGSGRTASFTLPRGQRFADAFHTFAIQWSATSVQLYVDGSLYSTVKPSAIPTGTQWVFDAPFFLLLNVAVGGSWPGNPDATTQFPQQMLVDYVRVYEAVAASNAGALGLVDAASFLKPLAPGSLASVFGDALTPKTVENTFDASTGRFLTSVNGTSVLTNGVPSPLLYVSPGQINFQIPPDALVGNTLNVEVMNDGVLGAPAAVMLGAAAPSVFAVTCSAANCALWGNGFGPAPSGCKLTIGGVDAPVSYCGAAPGLLISQLNFVYPSDVTSRNASLTVSGVTSAVTLGLP